jgi:hypothetical protein
MPETDDRGRFVAGATLLWDRKDRPVVRCVLVDPDGESDGFATTVLAHIREHGNPDGFSVYRGIERPTDGKPVLLAGAFHGDRVVFFGAQFGGAVLGLPEVFGADSQLNPSAITSRIEAILSDLYEPTFQAIDS